MCRPKCTAKKVREVVVDRKKNVKNNMKSTDNGAVGGTAGSDKMS
jgi:hypothetical protein